MPSCLAYSLHSLQFMIYGLSNTPDHNSVIKMDDSVPITTIKAIPPRYVPGQPNLDNLPWKVLFQVILEYINLTKLTVTVVSVKYRPSLLQNRHYVLSNILCKFITV